VVTAEQTTAFDIAVMPVGQGIPVAGSGQLHYKINGGDVQTVALTERSTNDYEAVLPAGQGGGDLVNGTPDPIGGCNGANVYGYNIYGDYENAMQERHLTGPAIDCSGMNNVHLKFARWLGVEQPSYDHAYVRVSNNGTDWVTVWENTCTLGDREWVDMDLDISSVADDQSAVYLRWTMGTTDGEVRYCGWNIDDVRIVSYQCIPYVCGDADGDEQVKMLDILHLINYLYKGGAAPESRDAADVNSDTIH
jgi:hypothetical protein